jgi:hypothetical protein
MLVRAQDSAIIGALARVLRGMELAAGLQKADSQGRKHHDVDRLHRAGRRRSQDAQALCIIRIGIVRGCFLATELKNVRRRRDALRVSQAPIQIIDNPRISFASFDCLHAFDRLLTREKTSVRLATRILAAVSVRKWPHE